MSSAVLSGLFRNSAAIYGVLLVVGTLIVITFVVGWIVMVRRGSNKEWPIR